MNKVTRYCLKFLQNFCVGIFVSLAIFTMALQMPIVQRKILDHALDYVSRKTGYQLTCHKLQIHGLCKVCLLDIHVQDVNHQPVLNIHQLNIDPKLISLLLSKRACIDFVGFMGVKAYFSTSIQSNVEPSIWFKNLFLSFLLGGKSSWLINKLQLHDVDFLYYDSFKKAYKVKQRCNLQLSKVSIFKNGYAGNVTFCSLQDMYRNTYLIKALHTQFVIKPHVILFKKCKLRTKYSHLKGDFWLHQDQDLLLFSDLETLKVKAQFDQTELSTVELMPYVDVFCGKEQIYKLDGNMTLSYKAIEWENLMLSFSKSFVKGSGSFQRMPCKVDIFFDEGLVYVDDFRFYLSYLLNDYTKALQYISFQKSILKGTPSQLQWVSAMHTNLGHVHANCILQAPSGWRLQGINYNGKVTLSNFALHKVINFLPITSLSGECVITSKGAVHTKTMSCDVKLTEIQTPLYSCKNITVVLLLNKGLLSFDVNSKDPYAKLCFSGSYDFKNHILAHGIIESMHLNNFAMGIVPFKIGTCFSLDLYNLFSQFPKGKIHFTQCKLFTLEKSAILQHITIHTHSQDNKHVLALKSDWADIECTGLFTLDTLLSHIAQFIGHVKNPKAKLLFHKTLHVDYFVALKSNVLSNWVSDHIDIAPATTLSGKFSFEDIYHFSLHCAVVSSMRFKQVYFKNAKFSCILQDLNNHKHREVRVRLVSEAQDWCQTFQTDHLNIQCILDKDKLCIEQYIALPKDKGYINMACSGMIQDDLLLIHIVPSICMINGKQWKILEDRPTKITKAAIEVGNIHMISGDAVALIGGQLKESSGKSLDVVIRNVDVEDFFELKHIKGRLYADVSTSLQSGQFVVNGQINLHNCTLFNHTIGMLKTKIYGNSLEKKLFIESLLEKEDKQLLKLFGYYVPFQKKDSINLTTQLKDMDLYFLNLITDPIFSQIEGKLTGKFSITGTLHHPILNGTGIVRKGKLQINYLHTCYTVNLGLTVKDNVCDMDFIDLQDSHKGKANLVGRIVLEKGFPLTLSGNVSHLHVLNTVYQYGTPIFGSLYATGKLNFQGPIKNLSCKLSATIENGVFTILVNDEQGLQYNNLIHFTQKQVAKVDIPIQPIVQTPTIDAWLDLIISPNIKAKVVFGSSKNKDYIEGNGKGHIQLQVATHRDPYIGGHFFFQEGVCTISMFDVFRREFTILSNSKISFNGYPQQAIASINALHRQMVSVSTKNAAKTLSVPVDILFNLSGQLAFPYITYKLLFPEKSDDTYIRVHLDQCYSKSLVDNVYLNRQILSILISKRLYDDHEKISGWDAIRNSVDDLLSRQIKHLVSKVDENLDFEVDFGFNQWSKSAFNPWQQIKIGVGYQFGKYRISSKLGRFSNLLNDWQIDYEISKAISARVYLHSLDKVSKNSSRLGFWLVYKF